MHIIQRSVIFVVLSISACHFGVSGQYIQYKANAPARQQTVDRQYDTATQNEYEYYYEDEIDDFGTTQSIGLTTARSTTTTTTTTTTTPKPITSYRLLTTHRNGFRPLPNKKKFDPTITRQFQPNQPDSNTEASNDNTYVQKPNQLKQSAASTPQLRNAIADVNRRTAGKEYVQEKSSESDNGNGSGGFSRRYARFLFKLRSG